MPVLDINGRTVEVDDSFLKLSPDQQNATVDEIAKSFAPEPAAAPAYQGSTMADVGKSALSGGVRGLTGLAGLPADALDLATRGIDYLAGTKTNENYGKPASDYAGSEALTKALEKRTGPLYKPQTTLGGYAQTAFEFLPAMIGGPESLAVKAATRVAIPAIASETAGLAAKGTEAEPYARVGGALLGAGGATKIARGLEEGAAAKAAAKAAPTAAELDSATTAGYNHPAVKALEIDSTRTNDLVNTIGNNLKKDRFSEKQAPKTYDALEGLRTAEFGPNHTMADFDATRRVLNKIAVDQSTEGEAARRAIRSIDAYTARIPTAHVISGDAKAASQALFDARANAAVGFRNKTIEQVIQTAKDAAGSTYSGGNLENKLRQGVAALLKNQKQLRGFNMEEREALRQFARGSASANVMRRVAKILGGGGGLGQLASSAAGSAVAGPFGMVAAPAIGIAANKLGSARAMKELERIAAKVRSRAPAATPFISLPATPSLTAKQRALLSSFLTQNALGASSPLQLQGYAGQ